MTNGSSNIERASMDGTIRTVIHSTIFSIVDITLDYSTQTLYWANYSHHIGSSNANGSNKRSLTLNVSNVQIVDFFEGNLYYYTSYWGRIALASTIMMPNADQIRYGFVTHCGNMRDIKVISEARQITGIIYNYYKAIYIYIYNYIIDLIYFHLVFFHY